MGSPEASPIFWAKMRLSNWFASHITGHQGGWNEERGWGAGAKELDLGGGKAEMEGQRRVGNGAESVNLINGGIRALCPLCGLR